MMWKGYKKGEIKIKGSQLQVYGRKEKEIRMKNREDAPIEKDNIPGYVMRKNPTAIFLSLCQEDCLWPI